LADDRAALIKQVKEANDIVDVVGSYVALRPVGQTFKGLCPFHNDHRPSFDVDPRRQRYRCWSCGQYGDVIKFVQEFDRVEFIEALEVLARRAGIAFKRGSSPQDGTRSRMLDVMRWAAEQFHKCLFESPFAADARRYLDERKLTEATLRTFGVGFAASGGDWLLQRAMAAGWPIDLLETVGLIAARQDGTGHYDRFRDRVIFPIRDARGQPVGFGGRILPSSPLSLKAPKYYNSTDTPLFTKSEHLYGLDQARLAAPGAGYLAVVEGYTDVLMAHQCGIKAVVSTMGTALNARHVHHLRRYTPRVVLVFDADAGGDTGVDRALEIFVSEEVDLTVATLPQGLDPCDLLAQQGPEPFQLALTQAVDVLEFKLHRAWESEASKGIEGQRRAVDAILGVIALSPELTGQAGQLKRELMVGRIARRLGVKEETVWARLHELRANRRPTQQQQRPATITDADQGDVGEQEQRSAPALGHERDLIDLLLAEPELVPEAAASLQPDEIEHPGLRRLAQHLFDLSAEGLPPDLDHLQARVAKDRLIDYALRAQDRGLSMSDRPVLLQRIVRIFAERRAAPRRHELQTQLQGVNDHDTAVVLLRQLQDRTL
jgi:DNA primase